MCQVTGDERDRLLGICREQNTQGWLQTTDYARALIRESGTIPAGEIEDRVAARLGRQSLFGREHPARFTFFIHEFVLRLPVGGPAVLFEQLQHLLRKATRPYLTLGWCPPRWAGTPR